MVREIIRMQSRWAAQAVECACAICRQPMPPSDVVFVNQTWVCARCKPVLLQQIQEGVAGQ
jgi:hypothetical protein